MLTSDLFENKTPAAWRAGYERGLKYYRQGPANPYEPGTEEAKDYADGYHNGELDSYDKYDTSTMNEGAVKELSQDLRSMSDAEFLARYKMTKAQARAEMKQGVAEVSKDTLDRYVEKAVDAHGHADFSARMSKDDPTLRSYHVDQKKTAEKRRQGISRALDRMSKTEGVAEGSDDVASATPAKNERGRFTAWDDDEPMRLKCEDGEFRTIQEINMLRQKIGMKPFSIKSQQGVAEGNLNEFAPGAGDEGGGEDPYKYPKPERYRRSSDYFGQFEADHFDREDFDDATGVFKGYWGKNQIAYFKFDNPAKTGSDDSGMGWYYEPQSSSSGNNTSAAPAVDRSDERKQQELGMIRAFLKSGNRPSPGSQIYQLMKKHGIEEGQDNPYGYEVGQTVKLQDGSQGQVLDIFDNSIEVLLVGGRTVTVDFRDAQVISEQDVAEGVAETMTMDQAKKVLRHYGADHFKTTTNELHFYKNGRPMSVDLIFNDDATRSVSISQLNSATRRLKGQGVAEGVEESNVKILQKLLADEGYTYPIGILSRRLKLLSTNQSKVLARLFVNAQRAQDEELKLELIDKIDGIISREAERRSDPWKGVAEAIDPNRNKAQRMIYKYFGQIYDYGDDDGLDYLDKQGDLWNQLMDKYNGEIEDIVAREPTAVLIKAAQELKGIAGDMKYELDEQGVSEGSDYSAVTNAVTRRIIQQHPEVLAKYGPVVVGQAIDEIAEFVGDVDEIGSSDVSGWTSQVIRSLARFAPLGDNGVEEGVVDTLKGAWEKIKNFDNPSRQQNNQELRKKQQLRRKEIKNQDIAEENLTEQDLAEAVSTLELADFLFKGLEQKFPKIIERYGHEVVGNAIMDVAEENLDVSSVSEVDMLIDDIIEKLQNYNGNDSGLTESTVSRLYYNVVGTSAPELRKDFGMRHDRRGWFLSESSGRNRIMDAQRAFGSPKLVEYSVSDATGGAAQLGPDNVISPVGSVPKSQRINTKKARK